MEHDRRDKKGVDKFEASKRRKILLEDLRSEIGERRGFLTRLAYVLGVTPARLQKALTLDGIDDRVGDSTYLFSEQLARRVEQALELEPCYLEGRPRGWWRLNDEPLLKLDTEVLSDVTRLYFAPHAAVKLARDFKVALGENAPEIRVDLALLGDDDRPVLFFKTVVRACSSAAIRNTELKDLLLAGWASGVEYVVLAMATGERLESPKPKYFTYRLAPGVVLASDEVLPAIGEVMPQFDR